MTFDELKQKARELPLKPGVYIMQNAKNEVIYVGKAKALKNRVSQYFQDSAGHTSKTRAMVAQIDHFDVIIAQSEFEALVLECALIKRHMPHYNILLKDGKGYPYIRLTAGEYPTFSIAGKVQEDGARYFGPYGSRGATQNIIDTLRTALKLPGCARKFPRDIGKERPCLNHHMGLCDGYCRPEMDQSRYREGIAQAVRLLEGKYDEVVDELTAEMERAAMDLRFERAAELRDRIRAIELLGKRQKVVAGSLADTDVVVSMDGVRHTLSAGTEVCLHPGQSITLTPGLYHRFWGEEGKGTVLVREVSMCNDDANDNCFYDPAGRFPEIIEDEAPLHLLCNEY